MAVTRGALLSFSDPLLGVPTYVGFQYNPTEVTRTFRSETGSGSSRRAAPLPAPEEYSLRLELDATDGLERGGPLTTALGISPRIAALEMLMQPVGSSLLGAAVGALGAALGLGGGGAAVPAAKLPLVLFVWGPSRITPVQVTSLVVRETAFDALLHPIHATADLGLVVLRKAELPQDERVARAAADYYQVAREAKAVLALPQVAELGG